MDTDTTANIDADEFLPSKPSKRSQQTKAGKKRTISTRTVDNDNDDQMQVDESTGIEGIRKTQAPKTKRKKHTNLEIRKVPVPSHRFAQNRFFFLSLTMTT